MWRRCWASRDAWYINVQLSGKRGKKRAGKTKQEALDNIQRWFAPDRARLSKLASRACQQSRRTFIAKDPGLTFVYFALAPITDMVKIGRSDAPHERLSDLQVGSPEKLQMLSTFLGPRDLEAYIHDRFKQYRSHGEWFHNSKALMEFATKDIFIEFSKYTDQVTA